MATDPLRETIINVLGSLELERIEKTAQTILQKDEIARLTTLLAEKNAEIAALRSAEVEPPEPTPIPPRPRKNGQHATA